MTTLRLAPGQQHRVQLTVNGEQRQGFCEPRTLLCDFLRHQLHAYGVHVGCEHGVCGACTILMNGRAVRSCTQLAVQADATHVTTVEGLSDEGALTILQRSFMHHHALQCGFCTPGILISATHFLKTNPHPSEVEVRDMLSGHLCRCTGYAAIVAAIRAAAAELASGGD
jgi:2-furoyl-CoA dehydrogenase 2Fe-2S iron sulfur subunit